MKHTAPPSDVLLLKRKGHKRHHRQTDYHLARWFWFFFFLATVLGGGYLGSEYYLKRTDARRIQEEMLTNMEVILAALDAYHKANGTYPPAFEKNSRGEKTLSWRVAILPYFFDANGNARYQDLYDAFNREQTWNHKDNWSLLDKMPHEYRSPLSLHRPDDPKNSYLTNYVVVRNPRSVFPENRQPISKSRITDPLSETAAVIEVSDEAAVAWTCPDDFAFEPRVKSSAAPRTFRPDALICGMCDGRAVILPIDVLPEELFRKKPPLTPEELEAENPFTRPFLRDNDSPVTSENASENAEETAKSEESVPAGEKEEGHEEYRPGQKNE